MSFLHFSRILRYKNVIYFIFNYLYILLHFKVNLFVSSSYEKGNIYLYDEISQTNLSTPIYMILGCYYDILIKNTMENAVLYDISYVLDGL